MPVSKSGFRGKCSIMLGLIVWSTLSPIILGFGPLQHRAFPRPERASAYAQALPAAAPAAGAGLGPVLAVARTPSSFTLDDLPNNQLTITYHVFNLRAEPVNEILLATSLEPGVTLQAATPTPDQNGQDLAFGLPSIPPYGEVTASLTVDAVPGPGPLAVDGGARAFGNLRTRAVEASIGPTTLRDTLGVSSDFLRSTLDANTGDRYVLRTIGQLGCDPAALFEFVRDDIGYEAYQGSLRGARGTLWSQAGNALDQASLLVALLRACGTPSQYVSGTLDVAPAQELILSMFDPVSRAVGGLEPADLPELGDVDVNQLLLHGTQFLPGADEVSDPANDPQLLAAAREHFWVEYFDGSGFVALDPTFGGAAVGQTFASAASRFVEVDDAVRHKVRFQLDTEFLPLGVGGTFLDVAAALTDPDDPDANIKRFGSIVVHEDTVLDQTLRTVELVGEPVSIGHFVDQFSFPGLITNSFNTYSPWLQVGDREHLIRGTDYEEAISSISSNILSGLFLRLTVVDGQGNARQFERALVDRLGFAVRQGQGGALDLDLSGDPVLGELDIFTVDVQPAQQDRSDLIARVGPFADQRAALADMLAAQASGEANAGEVAAANAAGREFLIAATRLVAKKFNVGARQISGILERQSLARAYFDSPRIVLVQARGRRLDGTPAPPTISIDLRKSDIRAVARPGQSQVAASALNASRGFSDAFLEAVVLRQISDRFVPSVFDVFGAAEEQSVPLRMIGPDNIADTDLLGLSDQARLRIGEAARAGRTVIAPAADVVIDGERKVLWLEIDPATGEAIAVSETGEHQALIEYATLAKKSFEDILKGYVEGTAGKDVLTPLDIGAAMHDLVSLDAMKTILNLLGLAGLTPPSPGQVAGQMVGIASILLIVVAGSVQAAVQDPGIFLRVDPEPLACCIPRHVASGSIQASAVLPDGDVTGSTRAAYYRAGSTALYPEALTGIGASGGPALGLNFATTVDLAPAVAAVNLDMTGGSLTVGGATNISAPANVGFSGYNGSIHGEEAGATDAVALDGAFERVLVLSVSPDAAAATQNDSVVVTPNIESNADDVYTLTAEAPAGWTVEMAADGTMTITPAPGLTAGTFEVRFTAQSETEPDLRAEASAFITLEPPAVVAVDLSVVPDTVFSVPHDGSLAQSAFRIEVHNLSATADTFDIAVSGLPAEDFTLAVDAVQVGPGETGVVGVAVHPATGLLAPGSPISFTASATGRLTGLRDAESASFPYPQVVGVLPSMDPPAMATTAGSTVEADLILTAAANVAESFGLSVDAPAGFSVSGVPSDANLTPGETLTFPVSVAVPSDAVAGTAVGVSVVADLCNGQPAEDCTVPQPSQRFADLRLLIGRTETIALQQSAIVAADLGLDDLAAALDDMGAALARLGTDPADPRLQARAIAAGNMLFNLLVEASLDSLALDLRDILVEIDSGDPARITAALGEVSALFAGLPDELAMVAAERDHAFTVGLLPSGRVVAPGEPAVYTVRLASSGAEPSTVNLLGVTGLPPDVSVDLSQDSVVLAPGDVVDDSSPTPIQLTLTSPTEQRPSLGFGLEAAVAEAPEVVRTAPGTLVVRESAVDVAAVTPSHRVVETPGDPVSITAELLNTANVPRAVQVGLRVEDSVGTTVFTATPTPVDLAAGTTPTTVDLGAVDTTGFAEGAFAAVVTVLTETGGAVPGRQGRATFLVGLPLDAAVTAEPTTVPPGDPQTVTSQVSVELHASTVPGAAFPDQYAKAASAAGAVDTPTAALGPPDHQVATISPGGSLVLDMGPDLDRLADGPDIDLVVFERDLDTCCESHPDGYQVEVAEESAGPYALLGTASGSRHTGDEFDLLTTGLASARFVRISPTSAAPIAIDAALAVHTHHAGGIRIEHFDPLGAYEDGIANSPVVGDLTGDGTPEVVVNVQTGAVNCETVVLDGATKAEHFRVILPEGRAGIGSAFCGNGTSPALGDLDGDGEPEILISSEASNWLIAVNPDGTELFRREIAGGLNVSPALENLDADPLPEIAWPGGYLESDGTVALDVILFEDPVAADLDGDGTPELIAHRIWGSLAAYKTDGTQVWSTRVVPGLGSIQLSRPAVADLNSDGRPDFVVMGINELGSVDGNPQARALHAVDTDGAILWQTYLPVPACPEGEFCAPPSVSRPAIADLNGDGSVEIATFVRNLDDFRDFVVAFDADGNELWRTEARDPGGVPAAVSTADLDGDGAAEVLWNGPVSGFTIFDGTTGAILYRDPRAHSPSGKDYPVVADVDADGALEVVTGSTDGLYIFGNDAGWAGGRGIWNQSDYRITNVNADLTIPADPPASWLVHNTYLFQPGVSGDLAGASVDVTHLLGDGVGFSASDASPPPASVSGQEIAWSADLADGVATTFAVPVDVPALQPGETSTISERTSVDATLVLPDGTETTVSIPFGPVTVHAPHVVSVAPAQQAVAPGEAADFEVGLRNVRDAAETFALDVIGVDPAWVAIAPSVSVPAGEEIVVPLTLSTSLATPVGTFDFLIVASGDQGTLDEAGARLEVSGEPSVPVAPSGTVHVEVTPEAAVAGQSTPALYRVRVTNVGDAVDSYELSGAFAPGFTGLFTDETVEVLPGLGNTREVVLALTPAEATPPGDYGFKVTAASTTDTSISDQASGVVTVIGNGVDVTISPAAGTPGTAYQLSVVNTGQVADTFDLTFGGSLGLLATLGTEVVALAPGASQGVPITLEGTDMLLPGDAELSVVATSQTDPAVQDLATAGVTIPPTQGVTAAFDPPVVELEEPGTAATLLRVDNTGNTEDAYSAAITGVSGSVAASLTGLDGQPTQAIDSFRLPGLSSGALVLNVTLETAGEGTVEVTVTSLSQPAIAVTATVVIRVNRITARIDIKPGSDTNPINRTSRGKTPVAILSTPDFDAPNRVDAASLTFGPTGAEDSLAFCSPGPEDVNADGLLDLVCHFQTRLAEFQCSDTEGVLRGLTVDGVPIEGRDAVRIVPCK